MRRILRLKHNTSAVVRGYAISLVSLCFILLVGGCSDGDVGPMAPSMTEIQSGSDFGNIDGGGSMEAGGGSGSEESDEISVSGEYIPGHSLKLKLNSDIKLRVGADAYHEATVITAQLTEKKKGRKIEELAFVFGPSMVFDEPVTLELSHSYIKNLEERDGTFTLWYYNESLRTWQVEEISFKDLDGKVRFEINHFSKYALGR